MSNTSELLTSARKHLTPNYAPPPIVIERGDGAWLWDTDGKQYLDFGTGIGVSAVGHAHPKVVAAVAAQIARVGHTGPALYNVPMIRLAERICNLAFGDRVFFANSGTEANEAALKIARRHFHDRGEARHELVGVQGGFHGRTMGALSVTAKEAYREGFGPLIPGTHLVAHGTIAALEAVVGPKTAAVIIEPILGNSGVVLPPRGYLAAVRELCTARGCLLIFDEIQTGIGRTGHWFAHQHEHVTPDIMTLAKGLGGGLPIGAMITTDAIAQAFQPGVHASTFGGNPVACAAGLATLDAIEEGGLLGRARVLGELLLAEIGTRCRRHSVVRDVRGRGLMIAVELDGAAKPYVAACREQGLLVTLAGDNVLRLLPPLVIDEAQAHLAVSRLDTALAAMVDKRVS